MDGRGAVNDLGVCLHEGVAQVRKTPNGSASPGHGGAAGSAACGRSGARTKSGSWRASAAAALRSAKARVADAANACTGGLHQYSEEPAYSGLAGGLQIQLSPCATAI